MAFAALALAACDSPIPRIDPASPLVADRPAEELARLSRGRDEYIAKCSGCHRLYGPAEGDYAYWQRWTDDMAERSKLSREEEERILAYLHVASRLTPAD
jgi:mono/diheme cytochrome c family protein